MNDAELSLETKQRRALELGRDYLGVANGHILRQNDDETDDVIITVGEESEPFVEGKTLDRATTYCRQTAERYAPVALSNAPEQEGTEDPADEKRRVDRYLGMPIFVDGEVYGTICFTAATPRETEFSTDEKTFVELIGQLLGRAIEAETYQQRVDQLSNVQRRSKQIYEALLQLAPNAIFVIDADSGAIETANDKATSLTGYTKSELRGMSIIDLHPDTKADSYTQLHDKNFDERILEQFDDGRPVLFERSDGTTTPVEISINKVEVEDNPVELAIVRDVSDRRSRKTELQRRREFFKQTQEAVDLGGWEVDLDSGDRQWTDEVYRIFGLQVGIELTTTEALDYFHPEDRSLITEAFERLKTKGKPYDLELRILTDDGDVRWVRMVGRPQYDEADDREGQPSRVLGIIRDITDRKARERDLRIKDQAIEASMVGITIGDANQPDIPIIYANTAFEEMTGYSKDKVIDENCRFLQGEDTNEETVAEIRRAIEAKESIQTEILNYRANGTPFWNELTISPVRGADSEEATHFVGIQKDVTAQKRRDRLFEVLDRVLRHNLRNDMNVIIGFSEAVADRTEGNVSMMAEEITETATELISLSNKVREFETDITDAKRLEKRDIRTDIEATVDSLRVDHPDTEFSIEGDEPLTVLATEQLKIALSELGENAAQYGASNVRYEPTTTDDGKVVIHIHDSGPGLPITERKVLESGRETPLEHSSGLGLWMVNWIITSLGGSVTTTVEDGTTVTVSLPAPSETDTIGRRTSAIGD